MKWRRRAARRAGHRPNVPKRGAATRRDALAAVGRFVRRALWAIAVCVIVWATATGYRLLAPRLHEWTELRDVQLIGLEHVTRDEAIDKLKLPASVSIMWLSPKRLAERLEAHPWIKTAEISRELPHRLIVHVVERRPAAVLRAENGLWLIDDEGHVLNAVSDGEAQDLPVLRGVDVESLQKGLSHARQAAQAGLRVAGLLGRSFEGRPEVDVHDRDNTVAYVDGLRFQFGPSAFEEKWDRYRKLEPHLAAGAAAKATAVSTSAKSVTGSATAKPAVWNEVDLRYPGKVIVRDRAVDSSQTRERG
ncbi:MAG TPA: FtsQ-type POTRA domain-containing protein [Nitrospirales bacterium]|nr:FtsQ-type POTRA domain-containing protein [Nitrospirales bacterium]